MGDLQFESLKVWPLCNIMNGIIIRVNEIWYRINFDREEEEEVIISIPREFPNGDYIENFKKLEPPEVNVFILTIRQKKDDSLILQLAAFDYMETRFMLFVDDPLHIFNLELPSYSPIKKYNNIILKEIQPWVFEIIYNYHSEFMNIKVTGQKFAVVWDWKRFWFRFVKYTSSSSS
jgi:hypothetical protein